MVLGRFLVVLCRLCRLEVIWWVCVMKWLCKGGEVGGVVIMVLCR